MAMYGDFKLALRQLLKSPGYTALAVAALALGIGANTAIFSAIDALFLRSLRFEDSARLVRVAASMADRGLNEVPISYPRYEAIVANQRAYTGVAAWAFTGLTVTGRGEPAQVPALRVSQDFFSVLGVRPAYGRGFLPAEDREGGPAVALLSFGYWQKNYGGDPRAIGSSLTLDGVSTTIIGIMPADLDVPFAQRDLFLPRVFDEEGLPRELIDKGSGYLFAAGRLLPDETIAAANERLKVVTARYAAANAANVDANAPLFCLSLQEDQVGNQRTMFYVLLATVGFVLVIACANVANLLLARFTHRRKEIAVRSALGASRSRLVRHFLAESLLTAGIAGLLGLAVAEWGVELLRRIGARPGNAIVRLDHIVLDGGVLGFAVAVALLSGIGLGLIPAVQASRADASEALKESSRGSTGGRGVGRLRATLLVTEVALCLVLLVGAGLLVDSFRRLRHVDPGFDPSRAALFNLTLPDGGYPTPARQAELYRQVVEQLRTVPGVTQAAGSDFLPLSGNDTLAPYAVEGRPIPEMKARPVAERPAVTPGYFAALGVPLKAGRDFTWRDTAASPKVVVISEGMARRVFGRENPLGHRLVTGILGTPREIVGVVGDVRFLNLSQAAGDEMYYPTAQVGDAFFTLLVRTSRPAGSLRGELSAAVHAVDPNLPVADPQPLADLLTQAVAGPQLAMGLLSGFAGLSLLLAGMGIYTVIAYVVTQRTHEIGIRMALGADPGVVFGMVMRQGMRLALTGLAVGLAATLALSRLLSGLLYGVSANDPWILAGVSAFLAAVAALACALPAWRAVRIEPLEALRAE